MGRHRTPFPSDSATAFRMRSQKQKDTICEIALRRMLHQSGLRYRIHCRPLPSLNRQADIVFRQSKLAVFVDGCFWHGCPTHWKPPKRNSDWWISKIEKNIERDRDTDTLLERAGWLVIRVWEHDDLELVVEQILDSVLLRHPRGASLVALQAKLSSQKP